MDPLSELFKKYGSDKGGNHLKAGDTCHNYGATYHKLLKNKREQIKYVLEIGIGYGCSLRAWRDYFPNALITGFDNNPDRLITEDRIQSFIADQSDAKSLGRALAAAGKQQYDLIVDDGSHEAVHQIYTTNWLWPCLADNGCYVIEDIHYDCKPQLYLDSINHGHWDVHATGIGLGRARCECGCGAGEVLLVGYQ